MKGPTIAASAWVAETATVRADVTLAEDASVWFGAVLRGAVVPPGMRVPAGMLAVGVPAKVRGPLTEEQRAAILVSRDHYLERKEQYRRGQY